jgi:hypothetical protein
MYLRYARFRSPPTLTRAAFTKRAMADSNDWLIFCYEIANKFQKHNFYSLSWQTAVCNSIVSNVRVANIVSAINLET